MSFTRFHDDPNRIRKQNEESTFIGRYMLNMPGPGSDLPFAEDPQLRLQRWGANLHTNTIGVENDLRGLTRKQNRDHIDHNQHNKFAASSSLSHFASAKPFVEESRASHPAWIYKDLEQSRWESPWLNPLNGLEKAFEENIQTRILEKDHHIPKMPVVAGEQWTHFYLAGPSLCIGGREESCNGAAYTQNQPIR
jgi:hypothetical protein